MTDTPCSCNSNWKQYAVHAPDVPLRKIADFEEHHVELKMDPAVQEMPVQSLITSPAAGDILSAAKAGYRSVFVKGIAWGGGGSGVNRVDVSLNGGKNFTVGHLCHPCAGVVAISMRARCHSDHPLLCRVTTSILLPMHMAHRSNGV